MGRAPCCEKVGLRRGRWTADEDNMLSNYIRARGEGSWRSLPKKAGLLRCGKSCRLRWINYLRSDLKRGNISAEEEDMIIKLHASLGNRWSLIAANLAGRTDNEIKNYWNSHISRKITLSSPTIPIKRRSIKIKKPHTKISTSLSKQQSNTVNPSAAGSGGGEVMHDSSTSAGDKNDKENEFDEVFFDESLLSMDPTTLFPLTDQEDLINDINSSTSSLTNDSSQVDHVDWGWEWDFEGGDNVLGFEEDDDIMSWPWKSSEEEVGVDVQKQDAMIAWLLS